MEKEHSRKDSAGESCQGNAYVSKDLSSGLYNLCKKLRTVPPASFPGLEGTGSVLGAQLTAQPALLRRLTLRVQ